MNTDLRHYLIISAILVVLFLTVLFIPINRGKNEVIIPTPAEKVVLPTKIIPKTTVISPTLIPPQTDTGAREVELPQGVKDLATQKQELRKATPLQLTGFIISFDYAEDKFIVNLQEPKVDTRISFETWLKANYPEIPLDRFEIN